MEVVLELWVEEDEADELSAEDSGQFSHEHGHEHAAAAGRAREARVAKLQAEALLRAYTACDAGDAPGPWCPVAPCVDTASAWVDAAMPLEWLPGERRLLGDGDVPVSAPAAQQHTLRKHRRHRSQAQRVSNGQGGLDVQRGLDAHAPAPVMATITGVAPLCVYVPSREADGSLSVRLALTGIHLGRCELLGRSKAACLRVDRQKVVKKAATVWVTVHGVTSPSCLLLEARMNELVSQSRAVLLLDSEAMASELQQPTSREGCEPNDAFIRDLGTWLEHCHDTRLAALHGDASMGSHAGQLLSPAAMDGLRSLVPSGNSLQPGQSGSLVHGRSVRSLTQKMRSLGLHLLEHAVGAGWCTVSNRIVYDLMDLHGLCIDSIFRLAASESLPLLHRAICSSHIQMLHTVLQWGDMHGYEWDLEQRVPTHTRKGRVLHVSALHLAAALRDDGYAAELLLLKYGKARQLWFLAKDSQGLLPHHYALAVGHDHLGKMAEGMPLTSGRPHSSDGAQPSWGSADSSYELPKLPGAPALTSAHTKGKRVPRAATINGISAVGKYLLEACQHVEGEGAGAGERLRLSSSPTGPLDAGADVEARVRDIEARWRDLEAARLQEVEAARRELEEGEEAAWRGLEEGPEAEVLDSASSDLDSASATAAEIEELGDLDGGALGAVVVDEWSSWESADVQAAAASRGAAASSGPRVVTNATGREGGRDCGDAGEQAAPTPVAPTMPLLAIPPAAMLAPPAAAAPGRSSLWTILSGLPALLDSPLATSWLQLHLLLLLCTAVCVPCVTGIVPSTWLLLTSLLVVLVVEAAVAMVWQLRQGG